MQVVAAVGSAAISDVENLLARLESAIAAIEQRRAADRLAITDLRQQQAHDRARLNQVETAASEAVTALDALIAETD